MTSPRSCRDSAPEQAYSERQIREEHMSAAEFIAARDFLIAHRDDYVTAYLVLRWPSLDRFNWALDYFDRMAYGNDRPALWIVNEGGGEQDLSLHEISEQS